MSTGSITEQLVPPEMEESSNIIPKQEEEGEEDANMKLIQITQEVMEEVQEEELEECKTPTWSSNKVPVIQNCPPAPRKKRRSVPPISSLRTKRSSATELRYAVKPEEVESFFLSMFELTKVNKRCRTI